LAKAVSFADGGYIAHVMVHCNIFVAMQHEPGRRINHASRIRGAEPPRCGRSNRQLLLTMR
jgi:hypothetical protein